MIRVMVAEDMEPIRQRYIRILNADDEIQVVCDVSSGQEAVALALKHHPDVILMDIEMESKKAGLNAVKEIMARLPDMIILMLTVYSHDELLFTAFQYGATDYLLKTSSPQALIRTVKEAYHGTLTLRSDVAKKLKAEFRRVREREASLLYVLNIVQTLTRTEIDVLLDLQRGLTRKEICACRFIEPSTLRSHIHHILKKFHASDIRQVVDHLNSLSLFELISRYSDEHKP